MEWLFDMFEEFIILRAILVSIVGYLIFATLYLLLVWCPVSAYAEAECLRAGYPRAQVSIGLERYCMTLDGSVRVVVVRK